MPHIKLATNFDQSPWLVSLDAAAQLAWVKLLCHFAKQGAAGGSQPLDPKVAADRFALPINTIERMLEAAQKGGALTSDDDRWQINGWPQFYTDLHEGDADACEDPVLPFDFEEDPSPKNFPAKSGEWGHP